MSSNQQVQGSSSNTGQSSGQGRGQAPSTSTPSTSPPSPRTLALLALSTTTFGSAMTVSSSTLHPYTSNVQTTLGYAINQRHGLLITIPRPAMSQIDLATHSVTNPASPTHPWIESVVVMALKPDSNDAVPQPAKILPSAHRTARMRLEGGTGPKAQSSSHGDPKADPELCASKK